MPTAWIRSFTGFIPRPHQAELTLEWLDLRSAMMNLMVHHDLALRFASGQAMGTIGPLGRKSMPPQDGRFCQGIARIRTNNAHLWVNDRAGIHTQALGSRLRGNDSLNHGLPDHEPSEPSENCGIRCGLL